MNIFIDTEDMEERYGEELYKEYLEKENKELREENLYLKLNNPEQNIEHLRIVKENKRKIDNLRKQNKELKEKINVYEDPEDLTLMFMYCDEKAKDKIKELHNKVDKAIKYIEHRKFIREQVILERSYKLDDFEVRKLLEILKDVDVNE